MSFREIILYKAVCRSLQKIGPVNKTATILDLMNITSFTHFAMSDWEAFWLSDRVSADLTVVRNLSEVDKPVVVYLLWSVVMIYELRRLLMSEFSLHIIGTKNVGKSTVIQEVFKLKDITCGSKVTQSTVVPVAYKVPTMSLLSVVDQPGSDDIVSMASRINVQTLQLGSHFLLLTDFRAAQFTSFLKLLLAVQCAQVSYTVVFTRCDEYVEEYGTREVFESEMKAIAHRLNQKLTSIRKVVEKIRAKSIEIAISGGGGGGEEGAVGGDGFDVKLELDKDLSEQAMGLSDAQVSYIRDEDAATWLMVAVNPRKFVMKELERQKRTLSEFGILDCVQFREHLTFILERFEAGLDLRGL